MYTQIVPLDYPLMMVAWKLAPALAAGCTTGAASPIRARRSRPLWLAELAAEVGIPAGA